MSLWDKTPSTLTSFTPLSSEVQASGNFLTRWFRKGKGKFIVPYLSKILDMLGQTIDPEAFAIHLVLFRISIISCQTDLNSSDFSKYGLTLEKPRMVIG